MDVEQKESVEIMAEESAAIIPASTFVEIFSPEQRAYRLADEKIREWQELFDIEEFVNPGDAYSLEQVCEDSGVGKYRDLSDEVRNATVQAMSAMAGYDIETCSEDMVILKFTEKGVESAQSEKGGAGAYLKTARPDTLIRIVDYVDTQLGRRYDMVYANEDFIAALTTSSSPGLSQ